MQAFPPTVWPPPADPAAGARLAETFAGLGGAERRFAATPAGGRLLAGLGGNAPYLAELAVRESGTLLQTMRAGPAAATADVLAALRRLPKRLARPELAYQLRQAKRRAALAIALADLGGTWSLAEITAALSDLADAALGAALRHLLRDLHDRRQIKLPHPANPEQQSGFVALALGKLGAGELNYSSDIDLVLLFDPHNPAYPDDAQSIMARLARDLVELLSQRTADGYVFRTDLRLRPDPAATPPVIALPAALRYYESQGRTWERAAFSKARPAGGDAALGAQFLAAIRPFIWRRHLDFAAIADIHDMKRRIDSKQEQKLPGFDVKLGRGGIREIEFIVQTLSLVWGGQDPAMRVPATLDALPALAKAGHLPDAVARELAADYRQLRRVEHRLQMIDDRQTHALPASTAGLTDFATFLNEPDFTDTFPKLLARVHEHFLAFFDAGAEAEQQYRIDPGTSGKPPAAFAMHVKDLGFRDVQHVAERLREWLSGRMQATRSDRARDLLAQCLPRLLTALGQQPEPDRAFARFDTMIARQPAGVQLFSLLQRNPQLVDRLAAVLGAAPALAEHLAQDGQALEALLAPAARFAAPKPILQRILREARDLEDSVNLTRRFVRREDFHLSVATLEGRLDTDQAGRLRSNLAQAALAALLPPVVAAHEARYGKLRGAAFGVVALGKAGGGEMLAGSDLDLLLIYDHAKLATAPTQYFVRMAHAFTGALTAQGPEGPLYKVDMRLRPSGNQGPVAVSLAAFRRYHAEESWTWERLALTRARVLAATGGFGRRVTQAIREALSRAQPAAMLRADARAMRDRLAAELPPAGPFDVKHRAGGMFEVGFIAETLQLIHDPAAPGLFHANTAAALRALGKAGHLPPDDVAVLLAADHLWRTVHGIDRITGLADKDTEPLPTMLAPLLRATATPDLDALLAAMARTGAAVRDCFDRHIEPGATAE